MITTVLFALGIFVLAFLGMAVGVIFSNRCIKASCGGLANLDGAESCSQCGGCSVSDQKQKDGTQVSATNACPVDDQK